MLATVSASLVLIVLDNSVLYTALPTLTGELGASSSESLWIINIYPLVTAGLLLGSGTLGDRIGHRRMFLTGLMLFGLASLAAAFSPTPELLIASRGLLAIGAASMMPATLALIRVSFPVERERNLAIAVWGSVSVVAAAIGPIVGGMLLEFFWWGSVFLINIPIVMVAFIATMLVAPPNLADATKRWDVVSSLQIMLGLAGAVLAIQNLMHTPPSWPIVLTAAFASLIGFILFVRRQRRLPYPLLDFSVFRNAAFTAGVVTAILAMFAVAGIELATTQRFQLVAGFTPLEAGLLVTALAAGTIPTGLLGGVFLHRTGLLPLIAGGFGLATIGVVASVAGFQASFGLLIAGLILTGAGLGSTMSVASIAIVGNVPVRRAGMASSVEEVSYEFGSLIAVALLGSLLTFVYSAAITLPEGAPVAAATSLTQALALAGNDQTVIDAAHTAFDTAYLVVLIVIAAVLVAATVVTARLLRHHGPGTRSQLHPGHE